MKRDSGQAIIHIGGMTCAMCAKNIESALLGVQGVTSAGINLIGQYAEVRYNPGSVSTDQLSNAVARAGYSFLGIEGEGETHGRVEASEMEVSRSRLSRAVVGFSVGLPLMVLHYVDFSLPWSKSWMLLILSSPIFLFVASPIFLAAFRSMRNRRLSMDVMYALGIGVAFLSSFLNTIGVLNAGELLFYDTALLLSAFLSLGRYLEARARGKTSSAIRNLLQLRPQVAIRVEEDGEHSITVDQITVGDHIRVPPGSRIPTDGKVLQGEGVVDESMLTGEPLPVVKVAGDVLIGGSLNQSALLEMVATRVGRDTILALIIRQVEEAQMSRPAAQLLADRVVSVFIPFILVVAVGAFLSWYLLAGGTFLFAVTTLIAVLVTACPCALGLATPTAMTVGLGRAAELGILIRNGDVLERLPRLSHVLFDKTGTLTRGEPLVLERVAIGLQDEELLRIAAAVERHAAHPLAEAIVADARQAGIPAGEVTKLENHPGRGVIAEYAGRRVILGSQKFLRELSIGITSEIGEFLAVRERLGRTVACVAVDGVLRGYFVLGDLIKPGVNQVLSEMKRMGLELHLVTGDNLSSAQAVATAVGIAHVWAGLTPGDKRMKVMELQRAGHVVAFIGDGINDAPAISQADVSIAIGSGTDIAIESADIVLLREELSAAVAAIQLGQKVMQRVKQNLFWAFAYNALLIPLAAGLLYPSTGIIFRPEFAGGAMALSSVTIVSLSLLLRRYLPPILRPKTA